tara:strand:- start:2042 stop:2530 length:489 start_codon:yes stop_codon:yes gene_type:complete
MTKKSKKKINQQNYAVNKKARAEFAISETIETGIQLVGSETKSIKTGGAVHLKEAFVRIMKGEVFLINAYIAPYENASWESHNETRTRKLLMHKKEIIRLWSKAQEKGLTLVPLRMYPKAHLIKLEVGLGKGKKAFEKRDDLKKRSVERDLNRDFKQSQIKV